MAALLPIIAAVLQASSFTLDKVILSIRGITFKTYAGFSFSVAFFVVLVIFLIVRPPFSLTLFYGKLSWLLLVSIGLLTMTNLLFYRALDSDLLGEVETIDLFGNIPLILLSTVLFADERNIIILIPALIASCALIWAHWNRHRFSFGKETALFAGWMLVGHPFAAVVSKTLLQAWNPISLELVRSGAIAVLLGFLFRNEVKKISPRFMSMLVLTNVLSSTALILFYFGYQELGVVHTMLLFSLQPILVYIASLALLKEKPQPRKIAAFCVVLVCIVVAQTMTMKS